MIRKLDNAFIELEVGGYSVLDALTASATASYTLQKNSANFTPSSANQLLVSLNGVIQKPGSSFTVSGSTLTFSSALTSSDSIDFILAMGEPLLVGTPSDGTLMQNLQVTCYNTKLLIQHYYCKDLLILLMSKLQ